MIVNFILYIITEAINLATAVLPVATLPSWFTDSISTVTGYFLNWGFIFPMSSFLLLVGFFVSVELAILAIFGVNAIIKVVRGSG